MKSLTKSLTMVLLTAALGFAFDAVPGTPGAFITAVAATAGMEFVAVQDSGIYMRPVGTQRWAHTGPFASPWNLSVYDSVVAVGFDRDGGSISTDAGTTWASFTYPLEAAEKSVPVVLRMLKSGLYCSGFQGSLYRSIDFGKSWMKIGGFGAQAYEVVQAGRYIIAEILSAGAAGLYRIDPETGDSVSVSIDSTAGKVHWLFNQGDSVVAITTIGLVYRFHSATSDWTPTGASLTFLAGSSKAGAGSGGIVVASGLDSLEIAYSENYGTSWSRISRMPMPNLWQGPGIPALIRSGGAIVFGSYGIRKLDSGTVLIRDDNQGLPSAPVTDFCISSNRIFAQSNFGLFASVDVSGSWDELASGSGVFAYCTETATYIRTNVIRKYLDAVASDTVPSPPVIPPGIPPDMFSDASTGVYAVMNNHITGNYIGTIYYLPEGGKEWKQLYKTGCLYCSINLFANDSDRLLTTILASTPQMPNRSAFVYSKDAGKIWDTLQVPYVDAVNSLKSSDGQFFAGSDSGLFTSADPSLGWKSFPTFAGKAAKILAARGTRLVAEKDSTILYASGDAGAHWAELEAPAAVPRIDKVELSDSLICMEAKQQLYCQSLSGLAPLPIAGRARVSVAKQGWHMVAGKAVLGAAKSEDAPLRIFDMSGREAHPPWATIRP